MKKNKKPTCVGFLLILNFKTYYFATGAAGAEAAAGAVADAAAVAEAAAGAEAATAGAGAATGAGAGAAGFSPQAERDKAKRAATSTENFIIFP
jgi:hypothetical protein